ncbi:hypothetical protein BMS3Abin11_02487 [bacterium BMS3Abin11]|nr:hypothetical protein BMS3Abin11_02487 [bacterium BMS3Abin11]
MSEDTSPWLLKNLHTGEFEEAQLHHKVLEQHVNDVEKSWKPILQEQLSKLKEKHQYGTEKYDHEKLFAEAGELMIQDANWDWKKKYKHLSFTIGYSGCSIICGGEIQGLGYFDVSEKYSSRIITEKPTGIVYIKFISSAPWNRKEISNQKYGGIGIALITHAIKISIDEGMDGRIGLHSLPQAEGFYKITCNMKDFGIDDNNKMRYFEMSQERATEWLS